MSYLDFFQSNCINNNNADTCDTELIKGKCFTMCPREEIEMRTREKLIHILEIYKGARCLVKCYSRSAADADMAKPNLLRPYSVLRKTMQHLVSNIMKRNDVPFNAVYDFVNDRLRAIRQDMTIQRLTPSQSVTLLEPMVRFYVYCGYRLCEHKISDYDPVLNKKHLLECLKLFLSCSDAMDNNRVEQISDLMSDLSVKASEKEIVDRPLMESLYILCNLNDMQPLQRYLSLSREMKNNPTMKLAFEIGVANLHGNYVRVVKLSKYLCPLGLCAFTLQLPYLQRRSLEVMSHGYSSKMLKVPSDVIRAWLCFNSDAEVVELCKHYGLNVEGNKVCFSKTDFKRDAIMLGPKKNLHSKALQVTVDEIFTYKSATFYK